MMLSQMVFVRQTDRMLISINIIIMIVFWLLVQLATACHFSCQGCIGEAYTECIGCPGQTTLKLINHESGLCLDYNLNAEANVFGCLILIVCIPLILLTQRKEILEFLNSLQNIAICSLIAVYQTSAQHYLYEGLQYMFLFMKIGWYTLSHSNERVLQAGRFELGRLVFHTEYISLSYICFIILGIYLGLALITLIAYAVSLFFH